MTAEKQIAILVQALLEAGRRLSWHVPGCRGGDFTKCRCSNAVAVRRIDAALKRAGYTEGFH